MDKINKGCFDRRGQEEIVGFVVIIILVAVIFLVFLGILIRQGPSEGQFESVELSQFLESLMEQTSECAISYEPAFSDVGELLEKCYSGAGCISGKSACEELNSTIGEALELSWDIGADKSEKGYIFEAVYKSGATREGILTFEKGECGDSFRGSLVSRPAFPGSIESSFKICY